MFVSANVSLQASAPPISGYYASRPNRVGDPNKGPHTVQQWTNPAASQRLDPVTQAGQFGNSSRNVARGLDYADFDASAIKAFRVTERVGIQFRAEFFNVANHANFELPVADMASADFGRILLAGPPRLTQFALKVTF